MRDITFDEISTLFDPNDWQVGYLSKENLHRCALHPVKQISLIGEKVENFSNDIYFRGESNGIVLSRRGHTWDYTIYKESLNIMDRLPSDIKFNIIHTNFKEAAILAGLGVRAKNSLIYSYKFGFDHHICAFRIGNKIVDYPKGARVNYKIWNRCVGCDDCAKACPVGAIHNASKHPFEWMIDSSACIDFIQYNDHETIPSIKDFWLKNVYPDLPQEHIDSLTDQKSAWDYLIHNGINWHDTLPWDRNGYSSDGHITYKDGVEIDVPVCRECTSQPRCSKWNGKYPYDRLPQRKQTITNE